MATTQLLDKRPLTYADYTAIDDGLRYELIHGRLIMAPAPKIKHQNTSGNLHLLIASYVKKKKLGTVLAAPTDVILDNHSTLQPDILFVAMERREIIEPHAIVGPPDLIVEIISPGSVEQDRYEKKGLYEQHGVQEYWLVDPENKSVEILALKEKRYELAQVVSEKGEILSYVIKGLKIDLAEIIPEGDGA